MLNGSLNGAFTKNGIICHRMLFGQFRGEQNIFANNQPRFGEFYMRYRNSSNVGEYRDKAPRDKPKGERRNDI